MSFATASRITTISSSEIGTNQKTSTGPVAASKDIQNPTRRSDFVSSVSRTSSTLKLPTITLLKISPPQTVPPSSVVSAGCHSRDKATTWNGTATGLLPTVSAINGSEAIDTFTISFQSGFRTIPAPVSLSFSPHDIPHESAPRLLNSITKSNIAASMSSNSSELPHSAYNSFRMLPSSTNTPEGILSATTATAGPIQESYSILSTTSNEPESNTSGNRGSQDHDSQPSSTSIASTPAPTVGLTLTSVLPSSYLNSTSTTTLSTSLSNSTTISLASKSTSMSNKTLLTSDSTSRSTTTLESMQSSTNTTAGTPRSDTRSTTSSGSVKTPPASSISTSGSTSYVSLTAGAPIVSSTIGVKILGDSRAVEGISTTDNVPSTTRVERPSSSPSDSWILSPNYPSSSSTDSSGDITSVFNPPLGSRVGSLSPSFTSTLPLGGPGVRFSTTLTSGSTESSASTETSDSPGSTSGLPPPLTIGQGSTGIPRQPSTLSTATGSPESAPSQLPPSAVTETNEVTCSTHPPSTVTATVCATAGPAANTTAGFTSSPGQAVTSGSSGAHGDGAGETTGQATTTTMSALRSGSGTDSPATSIPVPTTSAGGAASGMRQEVAGLGYWALGGLGLYVVLG